MRKNSDAGDGLNFGRDKRRKQKAPGYWKDKAGIRPYLEFESKTLKEPLGKDCLILYGDQLYQIPRQMPDFTGLKVLRPGLHLGTFKKNRFEPSHALGLALKPEQVQYPCLLSSTGTEIRDYLGGNPLKAEEGTGKGWVLVCVDGYSAGWAKAASGMLKNHYPKGLRIPNR